MKPTKNNNQKEERFPTLWSDFFDNEKFFGNRWFEREFNETLPAVNIKEKDGQFDIEFAAPGFSKSDFKINVEGNTLSVTAEKKEEKTDNNEKFTRKEFSYNSFSRSFTLPSTVNTDKIDARYNEGILRLNIPKTEEARNRKKEIQIG